MISFEKKRINNLLNITIIKHNNIKVYKGIPDIPLYTANNIIKRIDIVMENKLTETVCTEIVEKPEKAKKEKDRKTLCATPKLIEKLELLIKENGSSQKEFVEHIIKLMEVDNAKQRLSGSADMITEFEHYLTQLLEAFRLSLFLKESAESRAEEFFHEEIENLKQKISDLTNKNEYQKTENERLKSEATEAKEKLSEALKNVQNSSKTIESMEASIVDKNALLTAKMDEIEYLKHEAAFAATAKTEIVGLKATIAEQQMAMKDYERTTEDLKKEIQITKKEAEADIKTAVADAKAEAQQRLDSYIQKIEDKEYRISRLEYELAVAKLLNSSEKNEEDECEDELY